MNGYYSVFNPRGEKIADCGIERDALNLIGMRNRRWDGHYYTFIPLPGDIVDVSNKKLQPAYVEVQEVEYIEVGGQKIPTQQRLPKNCEEPFLPNFHD